MSKKTGYVQWFDKASGEGMIFNPWNGEALYVHWSAIKTDQKSLTKEQLNLEKWQPVEFTIYENLYMKQVETVWPLRFNYSVENEHKLTHLMNQCFDVGDPYMIKLSEIYYKEAA